MRLCSAPPGDDDASALTGLRIDLEFVGEPARAAEAEAEAGAGREAVAHGHLDVGDARALVLEGEAQPAPSEALDAFDGDLAAAAVLQGVPCELARGRDDLR